MRVRLAFAKKSGDVLVNVKNGSFEFHGQVYRTATQLEASLIAYSKKQAAPDESKREQFLTYEDEQP